MALKSDRYELQTDISFFYNAAATTRGCVVCHGGTAGTGAAMDQGANLCVKSDSSSANPLGVLLNDVVNKDLTRTHLNQYKDEVQKGGKVTILRKGYVVTNNITGTPAAGDVAYQCETTAGNVATSGTNVVGAFLSAKDADDYCKVEVNLP